MNASPQGGPVLRARIASLRLRVPAGDARSTRALALAVASSLASRVGALSGVAGRKTVRARLTAPASMSPERLVDSITRQIANPIADGSGRR